MKEKYDTFREIFRRNREDEIELEKYQKVGVFLLVVVISGFVGWVWEFLIHEVMGGFQQFFIEGGNLLPWVNLYAYGAIVIVITSYRLRKHPFAVFVVSGLACGLLELFAGWFSFTFQNGARYWDYTQSWWGVGNINGFVCPVSAIAFGLGALAVVYWLVPWCINLSQKMSKRAFLTLAISLFTLVIVDDVVNIALKCFGLPTAMNLYEMWGWKYKY